MGLKTGLKTMAKEEMKHVKDMAIISSKMASQRMRSIYETMDSVRIATEKKIVDGAVEAGKVVDKCITNIKSLNLGEQLSVAGFPGVARIPAENTKDVAQFIQKIVGKSDDVRLKGKGIDNTNRLIPGTPGNPTSGESTKLGENLLDSMGLPRSTSWKGYQAQHTIPSQLNKHPVIKKMEWI